MEFSLILLGKLVSMMLMAMVGCILVKGNALRPDDSRALSVLLVYVLQPCLIVHALQIELTPERLAGFLIGTVMATATMVLSILFGGATKKFLRLDDIDRACLIYANVGNLLMPLVSMSLGEEMVFYCSVFQIPFHLFCWTQGISLIRGDKSLNLRKVITNPCIIALAIGLFFLMTQITIPSVLGSAIKGFYDMVPAASMLLVGMIIADGDLHSVFTCKKAYLVSFLRLLLLPVLCMLLLYASGLLRHHPELRAVSMIVILGSAAPSGNMIVTLAVVNGKDAVKASIHNVMTTILCVVTIPLIIFLFQVLFPV